MSIAKTTRPHLLTREGAARIEWLEQRLRETAGELVQANDRIEALEAALEKMAIDSDAELTQLTHAIVDNIRKIEALEAALRAMVDEKCDYMHLNNLGDCEETHNVKLARAALEPDK